MLTNFTPDQIAAFWTGVGALAAVAASIVAIATLGALRKDSADRTRPVISAELRPVLLVAAPRRALVLRNGGATPARNVSVTFDPPLPELTGQEAESKMTSSLVRRYSSPIATWAPGMELSNLYFVGVSGPGDKWVNDEPVPDKFTVTLRYQDMRGRNYCDEYKLDDGVWPNETMSAPADNDDKGLRKREVRALEVIARGVGYR